MKAERVVGGYVQTVRRPSLLAYAGYEDCWDILWVACCFARNLWMRARRLLFLAYESNTTSVCRIGSLAYCQLFNFVMACFLNGVRFSKNAMAPSASTALGPGQSQKDQLLKRWVS